MTDLSNLIAEIAKQALGGQQQQQQQNTNLGGGLGGMLGSVLGQVLTQNNSNQQSQNHQPNLGNILGTVLGQMSGGQTQTNNKTSLLIAVLPIILAWIQKNGGIQGALTKLTQSGLGSQVQSWVSPTAPQNENIEQDQVQKLFDDADIEQVAAQTQQPKQDIYAAIATVLPQVIDSLTPNGHQTNQQEANTDIQNVLGGISSLLKPKS